MTYLWPPVRRVFEAIGVGEWLHDHATTIDRIDVYGPTAREDRTFELPTDSGIEPNRPLVVETEAFRRALTEQLPDRQSDDRRTVDTVTHHSDGLAVDFEDGVREWFDVVVDAGSGVDPSHQSDRVESPECTVLYQHETVIGTDSNSTNHIQERWYPDCLVQCLPRADTGSLLLNHDDSFQSTSVTARRSLRSVA
ncbi:FAD-dependent oxidoreductase [Natronoarchaeum sp. GCM10025703]|uniref:FAD-dependent oxidoreductase n=1 Tax=Natronoarchaeum sp. GCM10025703 TaxID=3252685 RepID=UPI00361A685F